MKPTDLRVALFSGNYNYVRDGANQALNRLVGYLLRQGVQVRVYSPTVKNPAFPATGDLVSVPAEQALGTCVPSGDESVRADLDHGVLTRARNQQAEAFLFQRL